MQAEFLYKGKAHTFEVDDAEPPVFTVYSARSCPKSPVIRFNLGLNRLDATRRVAVYDVLAFQSE